MSKRPGSTRNERHYDEKLLEELLTAKRDLLEELLRQGPDNDGAISKVFDFSSKAAEVFKKLFF